MNQINCGCASPKFPEPFQIQFLNTKGENLLDTSITKHYDADSIFTFTIKEADQVNRLGSGSILILNGSAEFNAISILDYGRNWQYTETHFLYLQLNNTDIDTIQLNFNLKESLVNPSQFLYNGKLLTKTENGGPFAKIIKNL